MTKLKQIDPATKGKRLKRLTVQPYLRGTNVYLKLFSNGKSIAFSTGLTCRHKQLDKKTLTIEGNESATNLLQALRADFQRTYTDFLLTKRTPDLREIRDVVLQKASADPSIPTLIECLETFFKNEFKALEGIDFERKTVEKKQFIVQRIKQYVITYHNNPHFKLSDLKLVDAQNLVNFCKRTFGHGHNHAVLHAEFLKRTCNYAIANEWLDKNPFAFFRPKRDRKDVVALREADIRALENMVFVGREYNYVKDVFLFCCATGLAYVDVSQLNASHIVALENESQLIKIRRGKNGNMCVIPLVPKALQILHKYSNNPDCLVNNRLLPVYANQVMNRILKEIQAICKIQVRLTTHVARKTCASFYIANGVPLTSVATMLGHKKTSTTELYYTERTEEAVIRHINEFQARRNDEQPLSEAV
ncbi:tyrosine-type recombinase/integrase [Spirosoma sp. HMF4905]|uniref:Tyrosine-type recombinase/integrase n=1 Tax=Spirosoma arboris TaxID=2682092 RepID=A0A7K1S6Q2_9BACT|nr:site-specific integrase [Spirosoma arboris]MVM29306.1 tyrosine-type recombinase/integrase [Spirosoma arboris]